MQRWPEVQVARIRLCVFVSDVQIDALQENQLFWSSLMIFCLAQVIGWVLKVFLDLDI